MSIVRIQSSTIRKTLVGCFILAIGLNDVDATAATHHHPTKHHKKPAAVEITTPPEKKSESVPEWKKTIELPKILGYVQTDYNKFTHQGDTKEGNRFFIRRARLAASGISYPNWGYIFSVDDQDGTLRLEENYLSYLGFKNTTIKMGNYKEFFSLDDLTSSANLPFLERALPVRAFAPDYHVGLGITHYGTIKAENHTYTASIGVFGQEVGHSTATTGANHGGALTGRMTYAYYPKPSRLFTVGLSGSYGQPDGDHFVQYTTFPEAFASSTNYVNTGQIPNVDTISLYDLETALVTGPFSLQGEYIGDYLKRRAGAGSLNFHGWYGFASYFLTGESRKYDTKNGIFEGITPIHSYGAWELLGQLSYITLKDRTIQGGNEHNSTLGLNWYPNPTIRFMLNYVWVDASRIATQQNVLTTLKNDTHIFELRGQVSFG